MDTTHIHFSSIDEVKWLIEDFDEEILHIFSREVLRKIRNGEKGWEDMVPEGTAELIKDYRLFGYTRRPLTLSRRRPQKKK